MLLSLLVAGWLVCGVDSGVCWATPTLRFGTQYTTIPTGLGSQIQAMATGLLDGDLIPDIVAADSVAVVVLLNKRFNGTAFAFGRPIVVSTTVLSTSSIAIGDLDGNGRNDIVFGGSTSVVVLFTNATYFFAARKSVLTSALSYAWVGVGDFNRDGALDIAFSSYMTNAIGWFRNNGTGGFGVARNFGTPINPYHPIVAPFTRNSSSPILDIAVYSEFLGSFFIYANNGSGNFSLAPGIQPLPGSVEECVATAAAAHDFDRSGTVDLLCGSVASSSTSAVILYSNNGPGLGWRVPQLIYIAPLSTGVATFAVFVDPFTGDFDLLLNNGFGSFAVRSFTNATASQTAMVLGAGNEYATAMLAVRLDLGIEGFIVTDVYGGIVPYATLSPIEMVAVAAPNANLDSSLLGVYNDDYALDVTTPSSVNTYTALGLNSTAVLSLSQMASTARCSGACTGNAVRLDANGDGFDDVVFVRTPPDVFISDGTGDFQNGGLLNLTGTDQILNQVFVADMDADGFPDIVRCVTPDYNAYIYYMYRNLQNNSFGGGERMVSWIYGRYGAVGAIDANEFADLAIADTAAYIVLLLRNSSSAAGTLRIAVTSVNAMDVKLADADGDGILELFTMAYIDQSWVSCYRGLGGGLFAAPFDVFNYSSVPTMRAYTLPYPYYAIADMNNDGILDAVSDGAGIAIVFGLPPMPGPRFGVPRLVYTGTAVLTQVLDIDRDGYLDLSISNLVWLRSARTWLQPTAQIAREALETVVRVTPSVCGGPITCSCLARALRVSTPLCTSVVRIQLAANASCPQSGPASAGARAKIVIAPRVFDRVVFESAPGLAAPATISADTLDRPLFSVAANAVLELASLRLVGRSPSMQGTMQASSAAAAPLLSVDGGTLVLRNVAVFGCIGGAIATTAVGGSSISVANSSLWGNAAPFAGGAVALLGFNDSLSVVDSNFTSNTARGAHAGAGWATVGGGGVLAVGPKASALSSASFSRCILRLNSASAGSGGAVLIMPPDGPVSAARVSLANATLLDGNSAAVAGGAAAVVGAAGSVTRLEAGVQVLGSRALWGGALASLSTVYLGAAMPVTGSEVMLPASAPVRVGTVSGGTIAVARGAALANSRAAFGGSVIVCDGAVSIEAGAVLAGTSRASTMGAFALMCSVNAVNTPPPPSSWLATSPGDLLTSFCGGASGACLDEASGLTTAVVTPMVRSQVVAVSASSQSGGQIPVVRVRCVDAFGGPVFDSSVLLRATVSATGGSVSDVVASTVVVGLVTAVSEVYDFSGLITLAVRRWPETLGTIVHIDFAVDAPFVAPVAMDSADVAIDGCAIGFGRVSSADPNEALVCAACIGDSFSSEPNSVLPCASCPPRSQRTAQATNASDSASTACVCSAGAFSGIQPISAAGCAACPTGGVCVGGSGQPTPADGYFADGTVFIACPRPASCLAGGRCAAGYVGRLCGSCAHGWYSLNGRCLRCQGSQSAAVAAVLVLAGLLVCALLLWLNLAEGLSRFVSATIGLLGLQIAAMFGRLRFDWGPLADVCFDTLSIANLNIELASPECSIAKSIDAWTLKWVLTMAIPLFAAVAVAAVCLAALALRSVVPHGKWAALTVGQVADAGKRSWYQVLALLYLPLAAAALSPFGCERDEARRWVLRDQPSRLCYGAWWMRMLGPALVASLTYSIGFPLALFALLRRERRALDPVVFVLRHGFLVGRYRDAMWAYEAANICLRLGVVLAMTVLTTDAMRAAGALAVLASATVAVASYAPYRAQLHNRLAVVVLSATSAVLFGGLLQEWALRRVVVYGGIAVMLVGLLIGNVLDVAALRASKRDAGKDWRQTAQVGAAGDVDCSVLDARVLDDTALASRFGLGSSAAAGSGGRQSLTAVLSNGPSTRASDDNINCSVEMDTFEQALSK